MRVDSNNGNLWHFVCFLKEYMIYIYFEQEQEKIYYYTSNEMETVRLQIYSKEEEIFIKGLGELKMNESILMNQKLYICTCQQNSSLLLSIKQNVNDTFYTYYDLTDINEIVIGRTYGDIQYDSIHISNPHAKIIWKDDAYYIQDCESRNGIYCNMKRTFSKVLEVGDCIFIMGLKIIFAGYFLAINNPQNKVQMNPKIFQFVPLENKENIFKNNSKFHTYVPIKPFEISKHKLLNPPPCKEIEQIPYIYLIGPQLTMGLTTIASSLLMFQFNQSIKNSFFSNFISIISSCSMLFGSITWPYLMQRYEKKKSQKYNCKRKIIYDEYLLDQTNMIQKELALYKQWLLSLHMEFITKKEIDSKKHWFQFDFQDEILLCIGMASLELQIPYERQELKLEVDREGLLKKRDYFMQKEWILDDVPIFVSTQMHNEIHIYGNLQTRLNYLYYILLHITYIYNPIHLKIMIVANPDLVHSIPCFFPHMFDEENMRYICTTDEQFHRLFMKIKQRKQPIIIFVLTNRWNIYMKYQSLPTNSFICYFKEQNINKTMPYIELNQDKAYYISNQKKKELSWRMKPSQKESLFYLQSILMQQNDCITFPKSVSILQLWKVEKVSQLQIMKRWLQHNSEYTLHIPIGYNKHKEIIYLDMHEKAHGPHGIIAGMTGSGKSEFLISLILSLAIEYSPCDVAIMCIDYKGGGMAQALQELPHTVGIITNLDGNMIYRSILSLQGELTRRQSIFKKVSIQMNSSTMNIDIYQRLYHENKVTEPIPHLFIVADEFAELKQQQPQFMEQIIRIARIGRSLGVHLILATQKPTGVVDEQIMSNARFHICLKVADKADSMDILKCEDGALLQDVGRFYLQVGYNEIYEQAQSAFSKFVYLQQQNQECTLEQIDCIGQTQYRWARKYENDIYKTSELQAIIQEMNLMVSKLNIQVKPVCLPELPSQFNDNTIDKQIFAIADNPINQEQFYLFLQDELVNTLILSSDKGESEEFLKTIINTSIYVDIPFEFLIFDFDQGMLKQFINHPYVIDVITLEDKKEMYFIKHWLQEQFQIRKKLKQKKPLIILCHNFSTFINQNEDLEQVLLMCLQDQGRSQIYFIVTDTSTQLIKLRYIQLFKSMFIFYLQDEQEMFSLIQQQWKSSKNFLRAIWKKDAIYELQVKQTKMEQELWSTVATANKIPKLEQYLCSQNMLYDKQQKMLLPVGIYLDNRKIFELEVEGIWIITGYKSEIVAKQIYQMAKHYSKPMELLFHLDPLDKNLLQKQQVCRIYVVNVQFIENNLYSDWFKEFYAQQRIIWIGKGISQVQYQLNLQVPNIELEAFDGFILQENLRGIRWISG